MTDEPVDIRQPLPDLAHESLRAGLVAALDDLADQVQRMNGALLLLDTTSNFAQGTKNTAMAARDTLANVETRLTALATAGGALQSGVAALQEAVADLTARVAALEPAAEPDLEPTVPDPIDPEA